MKPTREQIERRDFVSQVVAVVAAVAAFALLAVLDGRL